MTASKPTAPQFKYHHVLDELKQYTPLKNHIRDLCKRDLPQDKKNFLEAIEKTSEEMVGFAYLKQALKLFYHWVDLDEQAVKLREVSKSTALMTDFTQRHLNDVENRLSDFKKYLELPQYRYGRSAQYKADMVYSAMASFQNRTASVTFSYPTSYPKMIEKNKKILPALLDQIYTLFDDYDKKNHFYFFHRRHHAAEARVVKVELNRIVLSDQSENKKIEAAISLLMREKNKIATKEQFSIDGQKGSSFCRRAIYAIELLDQEKARLQTNQVRLVR